MTWTDKLMKASQSAAGWSKQRLSQAKALMDERMARISEVPGLPDALLQVLRETRTSLTKLVSAVRSKQDLTALRGAMVDVVAGAVDALAAAAAKEPGTFTSVEDVRHYCKESIKWGSGVVDGVALIAGTFAVSTAAHTFGISFGHFFALCVVMGVLYSLSVGAAELFAVTSLLTYEGHPDPAQEALRLCAASRKYHRGAPEHPAAAGEDNPTQAGSTTSSPEARALAGTWVKLSLAGAMPVLNDRHMQDRLEALLVTLNSRQVP